MKLSVLIPTLNEAESIGYLRRLLAILNPQIVKYKPEVELITHDGGRAMSTGRKRNEMINYSTGDYFVQIDCDDIVPDYYIDELMTAIEKGPDVVTFCGAMTTNNVNRTNFTIKLGEKYEEREGQYFRFPNHLCCFKRSVVEHIKFPDLWVQEDYLWAKAVRDAGVLKNEIHIQKHMYLYDYKIKAKQYARRR